MELAANAPIVHVSLKQRLFSLILTDHSRRLIFLSSLHGALHVDEDKYTMLRGLADLNQRLDISDSVNGLVFPSKKWCYLWKGIDTKESIPYIGLDQCVRRVMDRCPPFLRYATDAEMVSDVQKVLSHYVAATTEKVCRIY